MLRTSGNFLAIVVLLVVGFGCKNLREAANTSTSPTPRAGASAANSSTPATTVSDENSAESGTGVEKEKPSPGKGNVQGKALFNGKPAVGVDVKLCEKFNQFMGGCSGKTFTTKTDDNGEYLIKDVPPATYEGLTVRVFNTPYYVFATSGIVSAAKYVIEPDKTFFATDANLFKSDLKVTNPKMNGKLAASGIEVKWDTYPDAAYYKLGVFADTTSGAEANYDYINKKVEGTSFLLDTPLKPGKYWIKLEAFNSDDVKISMNAEDVKFTVTP